MDKVMVTIKTGQLEYDYEIIKNTDTYVIMEQGKQVAEIECKDEWMQLSGAHLPDGCFVEIIHAIEANYN
ncbi:hypothetical protein [Mucilaginibacter sp. UR6-11]|uniref:hypothetical protein n=1 Tax=Mucilaginibacter sp. UR6-11 TaxID=1435644 RepID=UPI001E4164D1|nr:hypothetical protein [Mucilaginibacter sp. UR6-11]MCC8423815.1 hypothetical protein [Mucilaginibacter sp. UR6-11]